MLPPEIRLIGLPGLPEVQPGDSLGELIAKAVTEAAVGVVGRDIFVVAQKVVSKAEGRVVNLKNIEPSELARKWSSAQGKDPRVIEVVLRQSRRIVRMDRGRLIVETHQGFVCANAGVDRSNTAAETVTLLPEDCDHSAESIRQTLLQKWGQPVAVIISDTSGRPWRQGLVGVALGVAGMEPLLDLRGVQDSRGRKLTSTVIDLADELASAADLVMGKTQHLPVAIVRGLRYQESCGSGRRLIRPPEKDLFR